MAKKHNSENEFLNPFATGVSYKTFLEAIPKGTTVKEYCEGNLTKEQIDWLDNDLTHYQESLEKKKQSKLINKKNKKQWQYPTHQ